MAQSFPVIKTAVLHMGASTRFVYELTPINPSQSNYDAQIDRNIGIISKKQQYTLAKKVIGIAGVGGMGGICAQILLRAGVQEIRIADPERFDRTNIGRQWGAMETTIGKSKALVTACLLRGILSDTTIKVYPMGINEETVDVFVEGCDLVLNEIEIFELVAPIVLNRATRARNIPMYDGNSAGFGTHVFAFTGASASLEDMLGISFEDAMTLEVKRKSGMTQKETTALIDMILRTFTPELQRTHPLEFDAIHARLVHEGKAPIFATNPTFAAGFLSDRICMELLPETLAHGTVLPPAPGYAYLDARLIETKIVSAA